MATIQDVVSVEIRRETNFVQTQNLDKILIVTKHYNSTGAYQQFSSLDDAIAAGYTLSATPWVYNAVREVFSQDVVPSYVLVTGNSALTNGQSYVDFISNFGGSNGQWLYLITDVVQTMFDLNPVFLAPPTQNTASAATTGGSLPIGTFFYEVTAENDNGETVGSNEQSIGTTTATSAVTISWQPVTGAKKYRIYRGNAAGAENIYYEVDASNTRFVDLGNVGSSGTVPTTNTAKVTPAPITQTIADSITLIANYIETTEKFYVVSVH